MELMQDACAGVGMNCDTHHIMHRGCYVSTHTSRRRAELVLRVAKKFHAIVREQLADHLEEIDCLNKKYDKDCHVNGCATHDFCNANMLMHEAWMGVFGRDSCCSSSDADTYVWNAAWKVAHRHGFNERWATRA